MKTYLNLQLLCVLPIIAITGCFRIETIKKDSWWLSPLSISKAQGSMWEKIDKSKIIIIPTNKISIAEKLLGNQKSVELTLKNIIQLAGIKKSIGGLKPYLVRALSFNSKTGRFYVRINNNRLHIHHGSLGTTNIMKRTPIIVFLKAPPEEIYVTCEISQ